MLQRGGCPPGGRGLGQSLSCSVRKGQAWLRVWKLEEWNIGSVHAGADRGRFRELTPPDQGGFRTGLRSLSSLKELTWGMKCPKNKTER